MSRAEEPTSGDPYDGNVFLAILAAFAIGFIGGALLAAGLVC